MESGLKMPRNFWWLLVITTLVGINIEPSSSSCYQAPEPVKNGEVDVINYSKHVNHFPNGTMAKVTCKPGYTLHKPELKTRYCVNNEWTNTPDDDVVCVAENAVVTCGRPPTVHHGTYTTITGEPWTAWKPSSTSTSSQFPPGTTMQPTCDPEYSLNCSYHCGRIRCDSGGTWIPVDGELISSCSALGGHVLGSISNDSSSNGNNGHGKHEAPEMNYFVLGLAVVCIVAVGALIIMALRRPLNCKKGGGTSEENPVMMASSSPAPPPLDSLPIAMNTGIFLPGARYDLQDCNFQDIPIVGTTVFK